MIQSRQTGSTRSNSIKLHKEISHMNLMQGETVLLKVAGNRLMV